jgi:diaminohydroxyphosphoribosylaminopyrimidine deaminase/5-amino-6-(5-phosphoribosylamino)uracil reductase
MDDLAHMRLAARVALRGRGGAEPNPTVGCVIAAAPPPEGRIVGWGYHRRCGGPQAEIVALERAGPRARGATAYVTLEPCSHAGRTGPCTEALIEAGIARVVYAEDDPGAGRGGAERLREAGVSVERLAEPAASAASRAFRHRIATGRPWVIAKWAQTLDGRIATRRGQSRYISNGRSRMLVHRERGRVDAILTGIGTVLADDPLLTARGVRVRRTARRVVVDPGLEIPLGCRLVETAAEAPTIVACDEPLRAGRAALALESRGVEVVGVPSPGGELDLARLLATLAARHDVATVLVDGGAGLLGRLFRAGLVNEAWVFVAPMLLGDEEALPCVRGLVAETLTQGTRLTLEHVRRRDGDVILRYLVRPEAQPPPAEA